MTKRDTVLQEIRPEIKAIKLDIALAVEEFQNESIRPIVKFQSDLLMAIMKSKIDLESAKKQNTSEQISWVKKTIDKDYKVKGLLIGVVTGLFTLNEWEVYNKNEKEFNKRITSIICQRFVDQILY